MIKLKSIKLEVIKLIYNNRHTIYTLVGAALMLLGSLKRE